MILVTGGAGYIGSHTCLELLRAGHQVVVVDNLSNSSATALERVAELAGRAPVFHQVDLRDDQGLARVFSSHPIDSVIHFAGLKAVGESVEQPLRYWDNNVTGTIRLLEAMTRHRVRTLVFSSSCTVYGTPPSVPIREDFPVSAVNPYGMTKLTIERILHDVYRADPGWAISILRYFNPVGADPSGRIGEDPAGVPMNLVPYITQVLMGRLPQLTIFGNDYPTRDGTGVRDFIHVTDLSLGHLAALADLAQGPRLVTYNLGTGRGSSVLEVVAAFEEVTGQEVPRQFAARRAGDVAEAWADTALATEKLTWRATRSLQTMCQDSWRWQQMNPIGYRG